MFLKKNKNQKDENPIDSFMLNQIIDVPEQSSIEFNEKYYQAFKDRIKKIDKVILSFKDPRNKRNNKRYSYDSLKEISDDFEKAEEREHRKCFKCGKELDLIEYLRESIKIYNRDIAYTILRSLKLWNTDYIEFLCCSCFPDFQIDDRMC